MGRLNFFEQAAKCYAEGTPHVVVTLVSARGETPSDPGSKALICETGLVTGTVGGGKVEMRAIQLAKELLLVKSCTPKLVTWNLQTDIGMTCGGEVTFLFETFSPSAWTIAVFGAGHCAQALVRAILPLECHLHGYDAREEWVEKFPPRSEKFFRETVANLADKVKELPQGTFFVVMTQGHAFDVPILDAIFREHPTTPYVGVIGSDLKGGKIRRELQARGIADGLLEKLRCPLGLRIGTSQPEEIAVSIVAELLQVRDRSVFSQTD